MMATVPSLSRLQSQAGITNIRAGVPFSPSISHSRLQVPSGSTKHCSVIARIYPSLSREASRRARVFVRAATATDGVDSATKEAINELANRVLRAMLDGEDGAKAQEQLDSARRDVEEAGQWLVGEGYMDAARFMLVLRGILKHKLIEEAEELLPQYRAAYEKMLFVIEDSGWVLAAPGQEEAAATEMVDDELIPPVLKSSYQ